MSKYLFIFRHNSAVACASGYLLGRILPTLSLKVCVASLTFIAEYGVIHHFLEVFPQYFTAVVPQQSTVLSISRMVYTVPGCHYQMWCIGKEPNISSWIAVRYTISLPLHFHSSHDAFLQNINCMYLLKWILYAKMV